MADKDTTPNKSILAHAAETREVFYDQNNTILAQLQKEGFSPGHSPSVKTLGASSSKVQKLEQLLEQAKPVFIRVEKEDRAVILSEPHFSK